MEHELVTTLVVALVAFLSAATAELERRARRRRRRERHERVTRSQPRSDLIVVAGAAVDAPLP